MQVNVVPYLIDNPSIGFVQARWTFTNPEESYLTKAGRLCLLLVYFSILRVITIACKLQATSDCAWMT